MWRLACPIQFRVTTVRGEHNRWKGHVIVMNIEAHEVESSRESGKDVTDREPANSPSDRSSRREALTLLGGSVAAGGALVLGTATPMRAQGQLVFASWVHGTIVQPENPDPYRVVRRGWGAECSGAIGGLNWFHFPIPTPVILQDVRNKVVKVFVLFRTSAARITNIHVWDGSTNIIRIDGLSLSGDRFDAVDGVNSRVLPVPAVMRFGLVISAGVEFQASDPDRPAISQVLFTSAGADFQRA